MLIWLQGLMLMHMLMLMLIWLQGGKLVWSDGSPADFSVWLEGGLNYYKVFLPLKLEVGLNFLCNVFLHALSSWFEGSDPPPLSWACIAVFATAIFQVRKFQGISNLKFQGFSNSKKLITDFFLRRRAAAQGSVKKKRTEWKTSMFAKSKSLPKVDPHTTYYMISNTQTKTCESVLINYLYRK